MHPVSPRSAPGRLRVLVGGRAVTVALVTAGVLLAAGACSSGDGAAAGGGSTTSPTTVEPVATTEVPAESGTQIFSYVPQVGDCFDRRRTTDGSSRPYILVLACQKPHSFEVFALVPIESSQFPGEGNLETLAKRECPKAWTEYVGQPYETSKLELSYEAPGSDDWALTLEHTLACLLRSPTTGGKLEGSKRESGE